MNLEDGPSTYAYSTADHSHTHSYLLPSLQEFLVRERPAKVFELGCGNGATAAWMYGHGINVTAIDNSVTGIALAKKNHSGVRFDLASAYADLAASYGSFPVVVSLEVVEHLYDPRRFASVVFNLLEPGGRCFISTPYHGYLKNVVLAVTGKMDAHFTALWDGGHIKFWSIATLRSAPARSGLRRDSIQASWPRSGSGKIDDRRCQKAEIVVSQARPLTQPGGRVWPGARNRRATSSLEPKEKRARLIRP